MHQSRQLLGVPIDLKCWCRAGTPLMKRMTLAMIKTVASKIPWANWMSKFNKWMISLNLKISKILAKVITKLRIIWTWREIASKHRLAITVLLMRKRWMILDHLCTSSQGTSYSKLLTNPKRVAARSRRLSPIHPISALGESLTRSTIAYLTINLIKKNIQNITSLVPSKQTTPVLQRLQKKMTSTSNVPSRFKTNRQRIWLA